MADVDPMDLDCHSLRDFLTLIAGVRETKPAGMREWDGLRALEDVVLDLAAKV